MRGRQVHRHLFRRRLDPERARSGAAGRCFLTLGTIITDDYLWFIENKYSDMVLATTEQTRVGYFTFEGVTMKDSWQRCWRASRRPRANPLATKAPPQAGLSGAVGFEFDPRWNDKPETIHLQPLLPAFAQIPARQPDARQNRHDLRRQFLRCMSPPRHGLFANSFLGSAAWRASASRLALRQAPSRQGKRAWTVAGDGGFMMVCQSLSTLARNKLNASFS